MGLETDGDGREAKTPWNDGGLCRAEKEALLERLERLTEIGIALSSERSLTKLLERILLEARRFTGAEAGTLYVRKADHLRFAVVQNDRIPPRSSPHGQLPIARTSIAGYVASTGDLLALDDVREIPEDAPYGFNDSFDRSSGFWTRSMLVIPMRAPEGEVNGVIQLINALSPSTGEAGPFDAGLLPLCRSLASQAGVALRNTQLTAELERSHEEAIFLLSRAAEYRDSDTGQHIRRVAHYTQAVARALGIGEPEARKLRLASPMHDVGKIRVPDSVLKKPGRLDPEERKEIERHTLYGDEILAPSTAPLLQLAREIARTHHERYDGGGYPAGIAGEEIPLSGRITAVVDVFDALTSKRCYKEAFSEEKACGILESEAGTHFDPQVVGAFLRILPEIRDVRARFAEEIPVTM